LAHPLAEDGRSVQAAHQELHQLLELSLFVAEAGRTPRDAASREAFLEAVANGSAVSWQHINLLGEYDFSDDKLQDTAI
jgi:hypothetical protein